MTTAKFTNELNELSDFLRENKAEEAKRLLTKVSGLLSARDESGRGCAHFAAVGGCLPLLEFSISQNPSVADEADDMGWTPLMIASSAGRPNIVRFLTSLPEVKINLANKNGQTPLHYAASKDHQEIVHILLQNGADVNAQDKFQATPLHRAASQGHDKIVHMLLARPNIRVDIRNSEGNTPLFLAAEEAREDAAIALAHKGADPEIRNKDEKCAFDVLHSTEFLIKLRNAAKRN